MALNIEGFDYFLPVLVFLFIFVIMYALLAKLKILGENKYINVIVSFIIAVIFVTLSSAREMVMRVTPWFAVLLILLFFVLLIIGFSQKKMENMMKPWLAWVFIIIFVIIVLFILFQNFGYSSNFGDFLLDVSLDYPKISGSVILLILAGLTSWVLIAKG